MKDTDKVELTVGAVKKAADSCGTAKEVLKKLFPEVFKGDWERVENIAWSDNCVVDSGLPNGPILWLISRGELKRKDEWFDGSLDYTYKIENYSIWRRKS